MDIKLAERCHYGMTMWINDELQALGCDGPDQIQSQLSADGMLVAHQLAQPQAWYRAQQPFLWSLSGIDFARIRRWEQQLRCCAQSGTHKQMKTTVLLLCVPAVPGISGQPAWRDDAGCNAVG